MDNQHTKRQKRIVRAEAMRGQTRQFTFEGTEMTGVISETDRSDDHVKMYVYTDNASPDPITKQRRGFAVWVPVKDVKL